ncbi:MAG: GGDEF domain-containing protein [Syntrophales bacterium]|jgi:diguanylate cyclase (GGDEF)-like protein
MNALWKSPSKQSKWLILAAGFVLLIPIGITEYIIGADLSVSIFYLIPIAMVTWYVDRESGFLIAVASVATCFFATYFARKSDIRLSISIWNSLIMLGYFFIFSYILANLKLSHDHEKYMARTDSLTGAANRRYFHELADIELKRSQRYSRPFTVAYIDIDDFKIINDDFGHNTGDELLCCFCETIAGELRSTDIFARAGGDEFVIILTETGDESSARVLMDRILKSLRTAMDDKGWSVTFSIGVAIFSNIPSSTDELINLPDQLMYAVKTGGKNAVQYKTF